MRLLTTQDGLPRVAWGPVIAGVILSSIVYLLMSVLGTAIGASMLSPLSRPDPLHGFGFGSGIWVIVTTVVAVFIGSYFAGRCAPVLGWLHGLLSWAVMVLLVAYGITSLVGSAVSTAGNVAATSAHAGATAANQANGNSVGSLVSSATQQLQASAASAASSPRAEQDARQAADMAARGVARASWYSFAALIVGAIIAIVSGGAGFRHQPPFEEGGGSVRDDGIVTSKGRVTRPSGAFR
ncbi:YrzE family protein [Caballeronia arationis]|uniref:YrzE family protein n=1 Tax=Caballeronia arationis TaxID=1777142 RepID=UPI0007890E07|nr:YrzE family protein [Caballeronia arationis]